MGSCGSRPFHHRSPRERSGGDRSEPSPRAQPSQAQLGGAASDALLLEATKAAGQVVYPFELESSLASDHTVFGHLLVHPNQDHVVRAVPLSAELGAQTVPAFGLKLFELVVPKPVQPLPMLRPS